MVRAELENRQFGEVPLFIVVGVLDVLGAAAYYATEAILIKHIRNSKKNPWCQRSGSWSGIQPIKDTAIAVCAGRTATNSYAIDFNQLDGKDQKIAVASYKNTQTGQTAAIRNAEGMTQILFYTINLPPKASNATTQDCLNAFTWILGTRAGDACQGANQNTRGGGYKFADGSIYSVDPTCIDPKCGRNV